MHQLGEELLLQCIFSSGAIVSSRDNLRHPDENAVQNVTAHALLQKVIAGSPAAFTEQAAYAYPVTDAFRAQRGLNQHPRAGPRLVLTVRKRKHHLVAAEEPESLGDV